MAAAMLSLLSTSSALRPANSAPAPSGALAPEHAVGCKDDTVAYLFLVDDSLPLADVWREYFEGCEPGKAVIHVHSQAAQPSVPEAWADLNVPVYFVDKPVEGSLRFGWSFVEVCTPSLAYPFAR